jgi:type I restriction enzyme, S subunit
MANYYTVYVKPSCLWTDETLIDKRIDAHFYSIKYMQYYNKLMKCKIKKISLYNICSRMNSGPFGSALLASQYVDKGVAFIRPLNCKDYIVDIDNDVVFISKEDSERLKSSKFSLGDLIFTKIGNGIGDVAIIPQKIFECNISGNLMGVKIKNNIDNYYVLTFLKSIYGQNQIWQGMMNSAKPKIDMDTLKSIVIPIPSPEIQKYIGDKVRKAEELREEAKRLKKEAEEIFYEAIEIDKLNSKLIKVTKFSWIKENQIEDRLDLKYNSPSIITIYEHFRKYKCSLLKDEFKTISGYAFSSGDFDDMDGEKVIKIGDISDFTIDTTTLTRVKIGTKVKERIREFSCNIQDLVYAMTGATIGKVAMYIDNETVYINQRVACIKPKRNNIPTGYLLLYLNSDIGKEISYSLSTGVAQPNIALEELNNIVIPQLANNIMDKIHHNVLNSLIKHKESKQLIQEAKRDVEDLIEGNFDMSKVKANS